MTRPTIPQLLVVAALALAIVALVAAIAERRSERAPWQEAQGRCRADGGEVVGDDLAWYCRGGRAP